MGCGGSKEGEDKSIDPNMEYIQASKFQDFFAPCEAILSQAEELRSGLEDSLETMYDLTFVKFLKTPPSLIDSFKVWIWTLSANNGGEIAKCNPSVTKESPYLDVDVGVVCSTCKNDADFFHENCTPNELAKYKEALRNYIETCIKGVTEIPALIEEIGKLIAAANELKDNAKDALDGLNFKDKAKSLSNIAKNIGKLTKGASKLKGIVPLIPEAVKNMEGLIKEAVEVVKTADEKGKTALDKKYTSFRQIMQFLHPGDKFSDSEIKQFIEDAEKKRKEQEEQKKKKASKLQQFLELKQALQSKKGEKSE